MSKLYTARSHLYRRQILQVNIRWKALDEIYKIYMLLHRSDLNISENVRQTFSHFSAKFAKIQLKIAKFDENVFDENFSELRVFIFISFFSNRSLSQIFVENVEHDF